MPAPGCFPAARTVVLSTTAPLLVLFLAACEDVPTGSPPEPQEAPSRALIGGADARPLAEASASARSAMSLDLPFHGHTESAAPAFVISNSGTGSAGYFSTSKLSSTTPALVAATNGTGPALRVHSTWVSPGIALNVIHEGTGHASVFELTNASNLFTAVQARTAGKGLAVHAVNTGTGIGGVFQITSATNASAVVQLETAGTGAVLVANHYGSSGSLALFQSGGKNRIRFTKGGKGFFNGGTQTGGADVAEAFEVEGAVREYEPGDVLVISTASDRKVEKADEAYSTRVIGVYATKPGVLLSERDIDESLDDMVPVGVVGVIPTKVSAENGAVRRGDLLVSASTPGHAMRADPERLRFGMVLGKALEEFPGSGTGMIRVLVNVK